MSDDTSKKPIIVIKKIIKKPAHHGGSWKIAYADFVTAMMAFFLLMWLLSMLNKFQLMGIANYFNKPLKNVYVDNKNNDINEKKIPKEETKKYKLQLTKKEKVEIDAKSRGTDAKSDASGNSKQTLKGKKDKVQNLKAEDDFEKNEELKSKFVKSLDSNQQVRQYKEQLKFEVVKDGMKINLHDLQNKPMFSLGKTDFELYAKPILKWLAAEINHTNKKVIIIGHTDSNQYKNNGYYSNWELSADRANATRRILIANGMNPDNIIRVEGAADSMPLNAKFSEDPVNRRIEIIVLTNEAAKRLLEQ